MVSVRPVTASDFERVYPLLDRHDPDLGEAAWRRIFDYRWRRDESHCGYALFDSGGEDAEEDAEVVGFLGCVFSDRTPQNSTQSVPFCNLTTWVVRPDYRGHSLSLMMPVMRMKTHTITDLSAGDDVIRVSRRLGFKDLDTAVRVLLPLPPGRFRQTPFQLGRLFEGDAIAALPLSAADRQVFNDHHAYPSCHQLVFKIGVDYCHIVYTLNTDDLLSYAHIQSVSHPDLFVRHHAMIRERIVQRSGIPLTIIDARLLPAALPYSYRLPLSSPRIYRSRQLAPFQINNLYSELTLLGFGTADSLLLGWREKMLSLCAPVMTRLAAWPSPSMPLPVLERGNAPVSVYFSTNPK